MRSPSRVQQLGLVFLLALLSGLALVRACMAGAGA
jgi:hypothetical protein